MGPRLEQAAVQAPDELRGRGLGESVAVDEAVELEHRRALLLTRASELCAQLSAASRSEQMGAQQQRQEWWAISVKGQI